MPHLTLPCARCGLDVEVTVRDEDIYARKKGSYYTVNWESHGPPCSRVCGEVCDVNAIELDDALNRHRDIEQHYQNGIKERREMARDDAADAQYRASIGD